MKELDQNHKNQNNFNEEIDLKKIFELLWDKKRLIIFITSIFAAFSLIYSLSLSNYYKSEALMSVVTQKTGPTSLSKVDSVAAMAGLTLPSSGGDKGSLAIATITSRAFLKHLLTFDNVLPSLVAAESYDASSKILTFDSSVYNEDTKNWIKSEPSYLEIYKKYYLSKLEISSDKQTGYIYLSVEHLSPVFAKDFLKLMIDECNNLLRQKELEESNNALSYLKLIITKTSLKEIKNSINTLIQTQLQTQMMASIAEDYVLKSIEPPFVPEDKSKPDRMFICIAGALMGLIFSVLFVLIRRYSLDSK